MNLTFIDNFERKLNTATVFDLKEYAARLDYLYLQMASLRGKPECAEELAQIDRPRIDALMEKIQAMLETDPLDKILASKDVDLAAVSAMFM